MKGNKWPNVLLMILAFHFGNTKFSVDLNLNEIGLRGQHSDFRGLNNRERNTKNHREILFFFFVFAILPVQRKSISIKPLLFMECLWWARSLSHYLETPKELWEASIRIPAWPVRILEFRDASWLTKGHSMNGCLSLDLSPVLSPKFLHSQCYTHSSVNMT